MGEAAGEDKALAGLGFQLTPCLPKQAVGVAGWASVGSNVRALKEVAQGSNQALILKNWAVRECGKYPGMCGMARYKLPQGQRRQRWGLDFSSLSVGNSQPRTVCSKGFWEVGPFNVLLGSFLLRGLKEKFRLICACFCLLR